MAQEMRKLTKSKLDNHRPIQVVADGGKHSVVGIALGEGQEVAAHTVVVLEMADDGFDGGPASQRPFDGLGEAALLAGDMDLEHFAVRALWPR